MDEATLTLSSPMTEEQWDMIADYDFNYTNEITFHTKHGKTVRFVKESAQPEVTEEAVKEYCHKRCLTVITNDLFHEMSARFSAQPERANGKWINDGDPATWVCSNCGYRVTGYNNTKFCPNCGCEMDR